jgi:hypothetical protein
MADINDNTINITISAPSADSNTISVVNPALKNNVVVNDARITPSERAKLLDSVTLTDNQTISTGSPISGDKSFQGSDVEFVAGNFTFGTNGNLKVNGGIPEVNTANLYLKRSGNTIDLSSQSIVKNTGVNGSKFSLSNTVGPVILSSTGPSTDGEVTVLASNKVVNKAPSVDVKITAGDGTFNILASHASNVTDRKRFEFTEDSVFKVYAKSTNLSPNYQEVFEIKPSDSNNDGLDYIRIGPQTVNEAYYDLPGSRGAQGQILQLNANNQLEFVDYSPIAQRMQAESTSIDSLIDVDTSSVSPNLNEALVWDGNNFVPGAISSSLNIGDLQDVDAPSPQVDYALVWTSNNKWEPRAQIDTNTTVLSTDATPTLGANLDVSTYSITTTETNGNISIDPNGTGNVSLGNFVFDADQSLAGKDNYVLTYDSSGNTIQLEPTALNLSGLSDVDTTGVSNYDVLVSDSSGNFTPISAFDAFMQGASTAAAGMPQSSSTFGDFDGDGVITFSDMQVLLGTLGSSVYDGNTQIEFIDVSPPAVSAAVSLLDSSNYNTQTATTSLDRMSLVAATSSASVYPYTWTVTTTLNNDNIRLHTQDGSQFGSWFETASIQVMNPSEIDVSAGSSFEDVQFALYLNVIRQYPTATSTENTYLVGDFITSDQAADLSILSNGDIFVSDVFQKDGGNTEMPNSVYLSFWVGINDDSEFGIVSLKFSNLKFKVSGPIE